MFVEPVGLELMIEGLTTYEHMRSEHYKQGVWEGSK